MTTRPTYRDRCKTAEQAWMTLREQYSEIACALGFIECDPYFGDPLVSHEEILERATKLAKAAA